MNNVNNRNSFSKTDSFSYEKDLWVSTFKLILLLRIVMMLFTVNLNLKEKV